MTRKELYRLSVEVSGDVLREYFGAPNSFKDMEATPTYKKIRKKVYDKLAPVLLTGDDAKFIPEEKL